VGIIDKDELSKEISTVRSCHAHPHFVSCSHLCLLLVYEVDSVTEQLKEDPRNVSGRKWMAKKSKVLDNFCVSHSYLISKVFQNRRNALERRIIGNFVSSVAGTLSMLRLNPSTLSIVKKDQSSG